MANWLPPIGNADSWWIRNVLGIGAPFVFAPFGVYSLIARSSLIFGLGRARGTTFEWVTGQQAILGGIGWLGLALGFFALCYADDHEKLNWLPKWLTAQAVIMIAVGFVGSAWYPIFRALG